MTRTTEKLYDILHLHEKMRKAYFYTPPSCASGRRWYEKKNSLTSEFELGGQKIKVVQETTCSCRHVYYKMAIYIDGQQTKKDIRFIKKALKSLKAA
jgi:hypothetical protein